jgi:hypothetical protein
METPEPVPVHVPAGRQPRLLERWGRAGRGSSDGHPSTPGAAMPPWPGSRPIR